MPPGYDGSRFRRSRNSRDRDEVILVPDSGFAPTAEHSEGSEELSVSGIPTQRGIMNRKASSANAEGVSYTEDPQESCPEDHADDSPQAYTESCEKELSAKGDKLSGILRSLGFRGGMSSDDLLLCAILFIIASDTEGDGRSVGDILLILALLLGIR